MMSSFLRPRVAACLTSLIVALATIIAGCGDGSPTDLGGGGGNNHVYGLSVTGWPDTANATSEPTDPISVTVTATLDGKPASYTAKFNGSDIPSPSSNLNLNPQQSINTGLFANGDKNVSLTAYVPPDSIDGNINASACSPTFFVSSAPKPSCFSVKLKAPKRPGRTVAATVAGVTVDLNANKFPVVFQPGKSYPMVIKLLGPQGQVFDQRSQTLTALADPSVTLHDVFALGDSTKFAGAKVYVVVSGQVKDSAMADASGVARFSGTYLGGPFYNGIKIRVDATSFGYKQTEFDAYAANMAGFVSPEKWNGYQLDLKSVYTVTAVDPDHVSYLGGFRTDSLVRTAKHGTWSVRIQGFSAADSQKIATRLVHTMQYEGRSVAFSSADTLFDLVITPSTGGTGSLVKDTAGYVTRGVVTLPSNPIDEAVDHECVGHAAFGLGHTDNTVSNMVRGVMGITLLKMDDPRNTFDWPYMRAAEAVVDYAATLPASLRDQARAVFRNSLRAGSK